MGEGTEKNRARGIVPGKQVSDVSHRWGQRRLLMFRWIQRCSWLELVQRSLNQYAHLAPATV